MRIAVLKCFFFISIHIGWSQTWVKVSAGSNCSLGIKSDGTLWFWGRNNYGEYGDESFNESLVPIQIGTQENWTDIACGGIHVLALKSDSTIWSWGSNYWGQLGHGNITWIGAPHQIGTDHDWVQIESGGFHSAAIKSDGTLWMWGSNEFGQLGIGSNAQVLNPVQVDSNHNWYSISLGGNHSLGFREEGSELVLYAWGANYAGQLGLGHNADTYSPMSVLLPVGHEVHWKSISAGFAFSTAIAKDSTAWTWGSNNHGQLASGDNVDKNIVTQINFLSNWKNLIAGSECCYAQLYDGSTYSWGFNFSGMLSLGTTQTQFLPTPCSFTSTNFESLAPAKGASNGFQTFGFHAIAIASDQLSICSVGENCCGALGNGTMISNTTFECNVASLVSVEENQSLDLLVFPNPCLGNFTIEAPFESGQVIQLLDLNGRCVHTQMLINSGFSHSFEIDLIPGVYQIQLLNQEGEKLANRRLVVGYQ